MIERSPNPAPWRPAVECLPRQELYALQRCALAQAVARAQEAPWQRERLHTLGTVDDTLEPARFQACVPLMSKADLRAAQTAAWNMAARRPALLLTTSGTTGTRVPLPYSSGDLTHWEELAARTLWANGLRPDDTVVLPVPLGLFSGGHGMFGGLRRLGCSVIPLGPAPTPTLIDVLRGGLGAAPTAIVSLPSHMLRLLDSLPATGVDPAATPLRLGSFGAEAWSEAARARIEAGFHIRAMDSYGIGELCGPGIAAECEARDGLHVWEDAFFVEIVDAEGQPVPDGTAGELVLTPLFREILPLLRYRTGDAAALLSEPCRCGRTHRRITRITHRLDQVRIITGVNVDPGDVERILYRFPWVGQEFALTIEGEHGDALHVQVERHGQHAPPADAEAQLVAAIRRDLPVRTRVTLCPHGTLERTPGKAQRFRAPETP
jgi:phenylacetate-CoA ligase